MKHVWIIRILGAILLVAGLTIRYVIAKRKFDRRAMTGAEGSRSFESSWFITLVERFGSGIAAFLIIAGIFLFIATLI